MTSSRARALPLVVLLTATAVLYLWGITVNGMGNQFYAAAVQSGSSNWKAWLFGSLDAQNFITVDKPPLALWVMGLSGRLFGFSSASMLIPQALMAVAAVALTYAAVARIGGRWAGLLAGAALAVTPVAVLMFRYNNPDAAMVLLMVAAAYCTVRAIQSGGARWLALAGVAVGLAFLAKMLEGAMVAPALAAAYLLAAPVSLARRCVHVLGAVAAVLVSAGWYVVLTLLWPASARPYLAGSSDNDFMNLVLGYNGLARVLGRNVEGFAAQGNTGSEGFGSASGSHGPTWMRLVSGEFGYEIGWLLPAALVATVFVVVLRGRAPRTDLVRAGAVLFGGWLVVDALVLTLMHGTIHPYYTLSIAPPVAAVFGLAVQQAWARRTQVWCRVALAIVVAGTGLLGWWLLGRTATGWQQVLRWPVLAVTAVAAGALVGPWLPRARPAVRGAALAAALLGVLAAPTAYSVTTVALPHHGGGPVVGPQRTAGHSDEGFDGVFGQSVDSPELDDMLKATHTRWSAAVIRSSSAAGLELASGTAVMAIGGFTGSDPTPTLGQFQDLVARHQIGYYVAMGTAGRQAGYATRSHQDITRWVAATFHPITVGRAQVYDLSTHQSA